MRNVVPESGARVIDFDDDGLKVLERCRLWGKRKAFFLATRGTDDFDRHLSRERHLDAHFRFLRPWLQRNDAAVITVESNPDGNAFRSGIRESD